MFKYTKEKIIEDIKEYLQDNDMSEEDIKTDNEDGPKYLSDIGPILDMVVSQVSGHGVMVIDNIDETDMRYIVSEYVNGKYITFITDNAFEKTMIEGVEDLADIIIEQEEIKDNYIKLIRISNETKT